MMRKAGALLATALWLSTGVMGFKPDKPASEYFVRSLPGMPPGVPLEKMHAGHIEIDESSNANLFFWHVQNKHIADKPRTVIWLNGGPGCSSLDGALMEVGPYRLLNDHTLIPNNGSWHEFANLLFVDQPVGTGFSYVDGDKYLHELPEMAAHFIIFLEKFFRTFPEYEKDQIYIAGESYAGQHIPYIAQAILDRNKKNHEQQMNVPDWNVAGLLIGNGWIDPLSQYDSYIPFAYEAGILEKDSSLAKVLETQRALCTKTLSDNGIHVDVRECEMVLTSFLDRSRHKGRQGQGNGACYNMYDVRLDDTYPDCGMNWPPDVHFMKPYLRRNDVIKALNVNPDKKSGWTECSGAVGSAFRAAKSRPAVELLPGLLEKMEILLFNGDKDLICNHVGTGTMIQNLSWNNGKGFELSPGVLAPREDWVFEGSPAGTYQTARNLTYVTFYNASHMVPFDYPRRSREMLDKFMRVDIGPIGGKPAESVIGGQKGPVNSVGGTPNSTEAEHKVKEKLEQAKWDAYYKSGEVALIVVAIAAVIWGIFVCRQRRRRSRARSLGRGRKGVDSTTRLEEGFEDNELGDIGNNVTERVPIYSAGVEDPMPGHRYSLGGVSSDEESDDERLAVKVEKPGNRGSSSS